MKNYSLKRFPLFGFALATAALVSACGGGSDTTSATASEPVSIGSTKADTLIVGAAGSEGLLMISNSDGSVAISAEAGTNASAQLIEGKGVYIPPGEDSRYPLGLSAIIESSRVETSGKSVAQLASATLADLFDEVAIADSTQPLDSSNFIGVISPSSVTATADAAARVTKGLPANSISALGGGVIVTKASPAPSGGDIELNLTLKIKDIVDDPTAVKPYGKGGDGSIAIKAKLSNLKSTFDVQASNKILGVIPTGLKSLDVRVTGEMTTEMSFTGGLDANLGSYNQAWKEVANSSLKLLGVTGKLSGLDSKDKIGKYPIAALVFSTSCPATCRYLAAKTQTPLRKAKNGGIVVWIYLDALGNLTLDGTTGLRTAAAVDMGMTMPEGGSLEPRFSAKNIGNANLADAPFFSGDLKYSARIGVSLEADAFILGVRTTSTGVFLGSEVAASVKGTYSRSWPNPLSEWQTVSDACYESDAGGGFIVNANFALGYEVKSTRFKKLNTSGAVKYGGTWPSDETRKVPGWAKLDGTNIPLWYFVKTTCPSSPNVEAAINVTPSSIGLGKSATLTWSSKNATSCTGSIAGSGVSGIGGSINVTPTTAGVVVYGITCSGPNGPVSSTASLTVTPAVSSSPVLVDAWVKYERSFASTTLDLAGSFNYNLSPPASAWLWTARSWYNSLHSVSGGYPNNPRVGDVTVLSDFPSYFGEFWGAKRNWIFSQSPIGNYYLDPTLGYLVSIDLTAHLERVVEIVSSPLFTPNPISEDITVIIKANDATSGIDAAVMPFSSQQTKYYWTKRKAFIVDANGNGYDDYGVHDNPPR
jgi:hypothetical protein